MKALKHKVLFDHCKACCARAREVRSYTDLVIDEFKRLHDKAVTRQAKEQAYRDCRLVKVRGALDGPIRAFEDELAKDN